MPQRIPNIGPDIGHLKIAFCDALIMLLNGSSSSLFRRENMNALEVMPKEQEESKEQKRNYNLN